MIENDCWHWDYYTQIEANQQRCHGDINSQVVLDTSFLLFIWLKPLLVSFYCYISSGCYSSICLFLWTLHPSVFHTCFIQFRVAGGLEPTPAVTGREAGYSLDRSPVHHRATQRQTRHNPTHSLLGPILESPMNPVGWCEEARVPGENPRIHGENMQTAPFLLGF